MRQLKLVELELENFKGLSSFKLTPEGEDIKVVGENATGKSTLYDAFLWLLFGEDSRRQSQFDVKPLNSAGVKDKETEVEVTGKFELEDEEFTLTRSYGNEYSYGVNGVPKKKSEYDEFLEERVDLETLRILVDPRYFNDGLHWEDRRERLMDLTEGVEVEDAVEVNSDLEDLDLKGLEPEDRRDQLKSEIDELEEEKKNIPVQIKTLQENAPEFEDEEPDDWEKFVKMLKVEKESLMDKKRSLEEEIADLKSSGKQAELRKKKNEIEANIDEFEQNWKSQFENDIEDQEKERKEVKQNFNEVKRQLKEKEQEREKAQERIEELDKRREHLRERWHEIREQKFDGEVCPICEQEIPEEGLEEVRKKINADKAQKIESIQEQGHKKKDQQEELEDKVEELSKEMANLEEEKNDLEKVWTGLDEKIEKLKMKRDEFAAQDKYRELQEEHEEVIEKLESGDEGPSDKLKEKKEQLEELESEIDEQNQAIAQAKEYRRTLDKVGQLKAKESKLAGKLETLRNQKRLVDEFVKTKAEILEDSINSKFDLVDFKLFEEYKSKPGVKETCETMVYSVSWSTLNNGARIRGGLDIIRTLGKEYGLQAVTWIDNAESITYIPEGGSHQMQLVVEEGVDELEVIS